MYYTTKIGSKHPIGRKTNGAKAQQDSVVLKAFWILYKYKIQKKGGNSSWKTSWKILAKDILQMES